MILKRNSFTQKCEVAIAVLLNVVAVVTPNVTPGVAVGHLQRVRQSAKRRVAAKQPDVADAPGQPTHVAGNAKNVVVGVVVVDARRQVGRQKLSPEVQVLRGTVFAGLARFRSFLEKHNLRFDRIAAW